MASFSHIPQGFLIFCLLTFSGLGSELQQANVNSVPELYAQAVAAFRAGQFDLAVARLNDVLALRPDVAEAHNLLGIIHDQKQRSREAERSFLKAIELRPDYVEARKNLAVHWGRQGRVQQAKVQLEEALRLDPSFSEAHYRIAFLYAHEGDFQRAVEHLGRIEAETNYQTATFYRLLGESFLQLEQPESAIEKLERAIKLDADNVALLAPLAAAYEQTGRLGDSLTTLRKALKIEPNTWDLRLALASVLLKQGEVENCLSELQAWPDSERTAEYYNLLGSGYAKLQKSVEAGKAFERALELDPDKVDPYYNLALLLLRADSYDEAVTVLEQALERRPESLQLLTSLGFAFQLQGKFQAAQEIFQQLIGKKPEDSSAYFYLGGSFLEAGQQKQALAAFEKAQSLAPEDASIFYLRGLIHSDSGDMTQALELFEKCLEINPSFPHAYTQRAKILFKRSDFSAALEDCRRAIELDPEMPQAHFQAAQILVRLGQREEAQKELTTYQRLKGKAEDKEFRVFKP